MAILRQQIFHGRQRNNQTHASTTDPDALLAQKASLPRWAGEVAYVRRGDVLYRYGNRGSSASRRLDAGIETADRIDDRESARCLAVANGCTCPGEIRRLSDTLWQLPEMPASSLNVGRLASEARPIAPPSWFTPACWIGFDSRNKVETIGGKLGV